MHKETVMSSLNWTQLGLLQHAMSQPTPKIYSACLYCPVPQLTCPPALSILIPPWNGVRGLIQC